MNPNLNGLPGWDKEEQRTKGISGGFFKQVWVCCTNSRGALSGYPREAATEVKALQTKLLRLGKTQKTRPRTLKQGRSPHGAVSHRGAFPPPYVGLALRQRSRLAKLSG